MPHIPLAHLQLITFIFVQADVDFLFAPLDDEDAEPQAAQPRARALATAFEPQVCLAFFLRARYITIILP